ncbi:hypothetical protein [Archangium violaceum]|uniref:hypothetical protein n=1 Tax=Archangium violaceum TaxID=83451 RepID=UPI0037BF1400
MVTHCKYEPAPPGMKWIFRSWIRDPMTGKRIYPKKSRVFRLLVPINGAPKD